MVCKNYYHSVNCPSYKNNALKGASSSSINNTKQLMFHQNEVRIISKVLEICKLYINKNSSQFQNPNDILKEVNESLQILKPGLNQLKGASSDSICNKDHLQDLLKLFNLT